MLSNAYHVVPDGRAYLHVLILGASYYVRKATEQTVPIPRDLSEGLEVSGEHVGRLV